jgi:hypothetical protein
MRLALFILCGSLLAGCASNPAQVTSNSSNPPSPIYDQAVAASLVYSPPITLYAPPLDLAREDREQAAFAGFEGVVTTFYHLRQDDYQASYGRHHFDDRFEREAITERVGVSYR